MKDARDAVSKGVQEAHKLPRLRKRKKRVDRSELKRSDADDYIKELLRRSDWPFSISQAVSDLTAVRPLRGVNGLQSPYSKMLKRKVAYESKGERTLICQLDACTFVTGFCEQPLKIPYQFKHYQKFYFPDLLIQTAEQIAIVIEIKGRDFLTDAETLAKRKGALEFLGP
ncbi:hypothetical protein SAMN04515695_0123 [Pseudovibrio sp. Tun.PSC04-5.I4]|nr:hypothetical protein SAMN04515695_0123 [Pseudovibrio sp. Tun.PSC04-5.I4]